MPAAPSVAHQLNSQVIKTHILDNGLQHFRLSSYKISHADGNRDIAGKFEDLFQRSRLRFCLSRSAQAINGSNGRSVDESLKAQQFI